MEGESACSAVAWTTGAAGLGPTRTDGTRGARNGGRYTPSPLTGISRAYSADRQARFVWLLLWYLAPTRKVAGHLRHGHWRSSCSFSPWFSVWYFSGNDKQEKDQDNHQVCCIKRADHLQRCFKTIIFSYCSALAGRGDSG